ncbi:hypothetical protein KQ306_03925 [Synechococcus sp. CS-1324]|uniref:hypothetical protein n=1 Tax=Synechococcus sp. CS-1324 TaxID=2847980 RepID=UPI00223AB4D6|nr:hypothetical protein [Synechococcus sp. CS-1324]MCT0230011.1 hypothetical protein [Synechococcus sp. CS-1324]
MKLQRYLKPIAPLVAVSAALLLTPGKADAKLTFNIFESGSDVVIQANGSLTLPQLVSFGNCAPIDTFSAGDGVICTNFANAQSIYNIAGPITFGGSNSSFSVTSSSGTPTAINASAQLFGLDSTYVNGDPIVSSATFLGQTLASLGLSPTTPGSRGTWQLKGIEGDAGEIEVIVGPPAAVPGPLPLFGAAAAFGWSRRLRKRISTAKTTQLG